MVTTQTKDDISMLVQLGMAACMNGDVYNARKMFENLLEYEPDLRAASLGLAFSRIVTDEFQEAEDILNGLSEDDDTLSLKVISLSLQRNSDEAGTIYNKIKDKHSPEALTAKQFMDYSADR
ncbi:MAG: tetratricopeptide repeat protein [Succinivibrio dextrinosolvens]|uniref:Tetratricopeptide repeat-containing protein n=1 Tax=Succinivibrio dextrinosolvens TaxID=83771 RepID=A0A662Z5K2_9GAMM|nr:MULTISPECIES: tetratricopeptide repeat protein [Succinivibrio]MBQ3678976.1 tetratricopeptide repeat protein [Succinivibrio sp.]MBQ9220997.1 tetratricopeptide repeat protein [Succinivibrio sp.]MDY6416454.1 tetratricopeptide repeat protein [Succinivibrio dextrinosolvens]MDY6419292.1 tetratricopeptide repeat protein [Succinivibrio dextrinosolvens]MDY6466910.1 tetratricopeptide repeat protein [Succinivibrio dextrinosolvens]